MRTYQLVSAILIVTCALLLPSGCEEQAAPPRQLSPNWFLQFEQSTQPMAGARVVRTSPTRTVPRISFEKVLHDFGVVSPETSSLCEFPFKNTGTGTLRIGEIEKVCGCTPFSLAKTEYAPGETGTLRVKYLSDTQLGATTKQLLVRSNDRTNPEVTLAIRATVAAKVDYEPKTLNLALRQDNAGCPALTLASTDNQPFAITHFTSTGNSITADFNPAVKATSFVLQPKVNMELLEKTLNGAIEIGLSHPECKKVTVGVNTLPRFRISPRSVIVRGVRADQPVVRKVRIQNNYGDPFELESASSQNGTVRILSNAIVNGGYELELEITPPADRTRTFSDAFFVKVKGGRQLEIPCNVFYSGAPAAAAAASKGQPKDCKVCGPRVIDPTTGEVTIHRESGSDS
ncbi:MAG: DUF1573 domain-containing protein [Planctomycetota bacterium]